MKFESLYRININSSQISSSHEEDGWLRGKGSWGKRGWLVARQLRASTSRWAVVNSRYQVRTGCYQHSKQKALGFCCSRGREREGVIKIWRLFPYSYNRVHWLKAESQASSAGLSPLWSSGECRVSSHFSIFPLLSASLSGVLVGDEALCVLQLQWAYTEWLQRMLFPSWESWCTHAHRVGDCAGQKACV